MDAVSLQKAAFDICKALVFMETFVRCCYYDYDPFISVIVIIMFIILIIVRSSGD
jgi:hypothetical protein